MRKPQSSEQRSIPWKQIFVPTDHNIRTDLPRVKELAASMKEVGQLVPVIVTNGGDGDQPYTLLGGYRRMKAFEINEWQNQEVLAVVRSCKKGDALGRLAINWRENGEREEVTPFDQAERAHQLLTGTYPILPGEEALPVPKDQVCALLGLTTSALNNLLRVFNNVDQKVAKEARKAGVPLRQLIAWAGIEGTGKDKEKSRAAKQAELLEEWITTQEALAAVGRKRQPRTKKAAASDGEEVGVLRPTRKIASGLKEKNADGESVDRKVAIADFMTVLESKLENTNSSRDGKDEALRLEGALNVLRFLTGKVKRFPGLTKDDFTALEPEEEEQEEQETDDSN